MPKMIIGIDDTDSNDGMCTTYLMTLIIEQLVKKYTLIDYPCLVRLNPSIQYKTRGNASLSIKIEIHSNQNVEQIKKFVTNEIQKHSMINCENTNPGVIFILEDKYEILKDELNCFYINALNSIINLNKTKNMLDLYKIDYFFLKNGRGLIGALAAIGYILNSKDADHTYEFIAYRKRENIGSKRNVNKETLIEFDKKTYPKIWDTIDYSRKNKPSVICLSHSNDPVLYGIRGENPKLLKNNIKIIKSEDIDKSCIFKTNQATDSHISEVANIFGMKNMCSYRIKGTVFEKSTTIIGGHEILVLLDEEENIFFCAAYEPTGKFRHTIRKLIKDDKVEVFGSFINNTLNLEKINILNLNNEYITMNPNCNICGKKMKSIGYNKGFKCKICRTQKKNKVIIKKIRNIEHGYYEVTPGSRRHLSKPLIRMITQNKNKYLDVKIHPLY